MILGKLLTTKYKNVKFVRVNRIRFVEEEAPASHLVDAMSC